jgi:negative regulator of flagellin synthesis FlgM
MMKIDQMFGSIGRMDGVNRPGKDNSVRQKSDKSSSSSSTDKATFSSGAQVLGKAMDGLKDAPEVRQDRIDQIRQDIMNGQYQINYDELAKRLSTKLWAQ